MGVKTWLWFFFPGQAVGCWVSERAVGMQNCISRPWGGALGQWRFLSVPGKPAALVSSCCRNPPLEFASPLPSLLPFLNVQHPPARASPPILTQKAEEFWILCRAWGATRTNPGSISRPWWRAGSELLSTSAPTGLVSQIPVQWHSAKLRNHNPSHQHWLMGANPCSSKLN